MVPQSDTLIVRSASDSRSDRSGTTVSERPSATRPTRRVHIFLPHFSLPSSLLAHRLPLVHRRKTTTTKFRSFPPPQPPAFPFPSYFSQRRSTLSRSHEAPVALYT